MMYMVASLSLGLGFQLFVLSQAEEQETWKCYEGLGLRGQNMFIKYCYEFDFGLKWSSL